MEPSESGQLLDAQALHAGPGDEPKSRLQPVVPRQASGSSRRLDHSCRVGRDRTSAKISTVTGAAAPRSTLLHATLSRLRPDLRELLWDALASAEVHLVGPYGEDGFIPQAEATIETDADVELELRAFARGAPELLKWV